MIAPPRRYRNRDFVWWLGVLGLWDLAAQKPGTEHVTISVSGAYGGSTMDFRRLASEGVMLVGRTQSFLDGTLYFADDASTNIAAGDKNYADMLDAADAYVLASGLDLPLEPEARKAWPEPSCLSNPLRSLNLADRECHNHYLGQRATSRISAGLKLMHLMRKALQFINGVFLKNLVYIF